MFLLAAENDRLRNEDILIQNIKVNQQCLKLPTNQYNNCQHIRGVN